MLFKYSLKSFRRYLFQNTLTTLQLSAALLIAAFMLSAVYLRLSRYLPFYEEFTSEGKLAVFTGFAYNGDLSSDYKAIDNSSDMSELLGIKVKTLGVHNCGAFIQGRENEIAVISVDDELIERYTPPLASGKWFEGERICAAVSADSGYSLGDSVRLKYYTSEGSEQTFSATITALIKEDAKIAGLSGENNGEQKDTFELFYQSSVKQDKSSVLLLKQSDLPSSKQSAYTGTVLITGSGLETSDITEKLSKSGCIYSVSMRELDKASRRYLLLKLYELLPIILILCIMSFITSISTSALSSREQINDYAAFTLCGLEKNKCIIIGLIQSIICLCSALVICIAAASVLIRLYPERFYIEPNAFLLSGDAGIMLIYIIIATAVPAAMIGRTTVKDMLGSL